MSKGSKRRPTNEKQFRDNYDKIFTRKKTPKHAQTQIHKNKKKTDGYWDSDFEEQCREYYGDNMPDVEDINWKKH